MQLIQDSDSPAVPEQYYFLVSLNFSVRLLILSEVLKFLSSAQVSRAALR